MSLTGAGRAARRSADRANARFADLPAGRHFRATVETVTAGAASDGNALVEVSWRGATFLVADYPDSYTPVKGHRVLCVLVDNQPSILHRGVGHP